MLWPCFSPLFRTAWTWKGVMPVCEWLLDAQALAFRVFFLFFSLSVVCGNDIMTGFSIFFPFFCGCVAHGHSASMVDY